MTKSQSSSNWRLLPEPDDIAAALTTAMNHGGQWAEVYAEQRTSSTIRLSGGGIAEVRTDMDLGAGARVASAERDGYAYTNVLSRRSLTEAAEAAATASGAMTRSRECSVTDLRERRVTPAQLAVRPPEDVHTQDKVTFLRRVDEAARAVSGEVRDVSATHVDVTQTVLIATTEGVLVRDGRVRTRLTCQVTVRRDGQLQTGFDGPGIGGGMELYGGDNTPEAIGVRAAQRALRALDGIDPPNGRMPVVLGPSGGGLLLHEACGHGLEADGLTRHSSIYAQSIDQCVGSSLVTAVDDPSLAGAFGSYAADDEGYDSSATTLLDRGMQTGALTDRANSVAIGARSANGRRQSYAHPPLARMSNTFILEGPQSADALLGSVQRGVYVVRLRGGDVDVTTGEFAFTATEAFLVERGEVVHPLLSLTMLGNGPAALASVEAVGDDLAFTQALCGKEDQWVPVSYGSPTLLISGLTISGGNHG